MKESDSVPAMQHLSGYSLFALQARFFLMLTDKAADINSMKTKTFITGFLLFVTTFSFAEMYKTNVEASYYAEQFHGKMTANGEIFNMNDFTCANRDLPFGTMLRVTNLANNLSVDVRVNDNGPNATDDKGRYKREIDLSKAAARKLDMLQSGTARVNIEILSLGPVPRKAAEKAAATAPTAPRTESASSETAAKLIPVFWDIQVGSFTQQEYANQLAQKLLRAGFEHVYFQKTDEVTRVVIKKVSDENLKETEEKLRNFGISDYLVKKNS